MLSLKLKNNKFFFLLRFRLIFLNFKYLGFINLNLQDYKNVEIRLNSLNLHFLKVKANELVFLYKYNYFLNFLKNNYILVYFDEFLDFANNFKDLNFSNFAFSGYFINNKYINYINKYYNFYSKNYNIYILIILQFINIYIKIIYLYVLKFIVLLLKLGLKKS